MAFDTVPNEEVFTYIRPDGLSLHGHRLPGDDPLLVFIHGFRSNHLGGKAAAVARFAAARGLGCLRLDQIGHGDSDGQFEDFRVSAAVQDTIAAIRGLEPARVILIGSSLGAMIALRITLSGQLPIGGALFIAPACHFISRHPDADDEAVLQHLEAQGFVESFDPYLKQPYRIPRAMIDDIRAMEPKPGPIALPCPVRLMHGTNDESIPHSESEDLHRRIAGSTLRLIEGGDHRLEGHTPVMLDELEALLSAAPSGSATTR
jgi:pimeloyl-ACP methyl ester carboxylesterase